MIVGASYQGVCYESVPDAAAAHCLMFPFAAGDYLYSCLSSSDYPVITQTRLSDNSVSSQYPLAVSYSACDQSVLQPGPWSMSADSAAQISLSVALIWALAWGIRQVIRVVSSGDSPIKDD